MKKILFVVLCVFCMSFIWGCSNGNPESTKKPVVTASSTQEQNMEPTPVITQKPTAEPTPPVVIDSENATYLSDLFNTDKMLYWIVNIASSEDINPERIPGVDTNYNQTEGPLMLSDYEYEKGIGLHPREGEVDSEIIFDISSFDYKYFTADIGMADPMSTGIVGYIYLDFGNGFEKVIDTDMMLFPDLYKATIELKGAQKIKLAINNFNGAHQNDSAGFGNCMMYNIID